MPKDDLVRLRHMLDASEEAVSFINDQTRSSLDSNRMLALSLVRCVEIIGEAASQVTKEYKSSNPQIPWPEIVAMRNRLIHAYFDIDLDRVWDTVKDDLPLLILQLKKIIPRSQSKAK